MKASITRMFSTSLVPAMWLALMMLAINACSVSDAPQPVTLGSDECTACKMVISDGKFACEYITDKGRCYKFDDLSCMFNYLHKNGIDMSTILKLYVADYSNPQVMIDVKTDQSGAGRGNPQPHEWRRSSLCRSCAGRADGCRIARLATRQLGATD